MTTPINLNRARKEKARGQKRATADMNAAKFGRTKTQRNAEAHDKDRAEAHLDQHRRDKP